MKRSNCGVVVSSKKNQSDQSHDLRLCMKNVPIDFTKHQVMSNFGLFEFPHVEIYMPVNCHNVNTRTKLVFLDFQRPWEAKVAQRLINLLKYGMITADFSRQNDKVETSIDGVLPSLGDSRTRIEGDLPYEGKCAFCKRLGANYVCEVCCTAYCCTFYCSVEHQTRDWKDHKYDCKPMPKLISSSEAAEAINAAKSSKSKGGKFVVPHVECFKAGGSVVITHVASERILFVRSVGEEFYTLVDIVNKKAVESPKLAKIPDINDIVLMPTVGKRYARAQVVDVFDPDEDENNLLLFLVDYGSSVKLPWSVLKVLSYQMRSLPRYTFKVIMDNVQVNHNTEVNNLLQGLFQNQKELQVVKVEAHRSERYVILKEENASETINQRIRNIIEVSSEGQRILFDESKVVELSTGGNIKIRVIETGRLKNGFIACMPHDKFPLFWDLERKLNQYGNKEAPDVPYDPIVNELCLVKMGERWERGYVIELMTDMISIMLVDKNLFKDVPRCHIRRLPAKLATNFFTQKCFVEGITEDNLPIANDMIGPKSMIVADTVRYDEDKKCFSLTLDLSFQIEK